MPFGRKRSYAPAYGRRIRRRYAGTRTTGKKVGYRKYIRKASSRIYSKPARFGFSRRVNRLNTMVAKSIRGMAESKIIAWRQTDYATPVTTPTGLGISAVKFIAGANALTQFNAYAPVGGFLCDQGDLKDQRSGQFIWLKNSVVNLTIQLNNEVPLGERVSPISFRVVVFKIKRALSPAGITVSPDTQLFLTNAGNNFGDSSPGASNMNAMDMMLQPVNTNNFRIICDRKFNLCHQQENASNGNTNNFAIQGNLKSYKHLKFDLKHNVKARYKVGATEPEDYDYRYAFAIYACYPNDLPTSQADIPTRWTASIRGTTVFNDV